MGRRLVMLGPPGSGKGTQAAKLSVVLAIPHVSTGQMLRDAVAAGTPLGETARRYMDGGNLVPDDVVTDMLLERLAGEDARCGYILDGYPRTIPQAAAIQERLGENRPELALALEVDDDEVVRRITGRRSCPHGHVFHVEFEPPATPDICDVCGAHLEQRTDDTEPVVRKRLEVYREETEPLLGFYRAQGMLRDVEGVGPLEDVLAALVKALL